MWRLPVPPPSVPNYGHERCVNAQHHKEVVAELNRKHYHAEQYHYKREKQLEAQIDNLMKHLMTAAATSIHPPIIVNVGQLYPPPITKGGTANVQTVTHNARDLAVQVSILESEKNRAEERAKKAEERADRAETKLEKQHRDERALYIYRDGSTRNEPVFYGPDGLLNVVCRARGDKPLDWVTLPTKNETFRLRFKIGRLYVYSQVY